MLNLKCAQVKRKTDICNILYTCNITRTRRRRDVMLITSVAKLRHFYNLLFHHMYNSTESINQDDLRYLNIDPSEVNIHY